MKAAWILLPLMLIFPSAALSQPPYEIGSPVLTDLWVDPVNGNNGNSGTARQSAVRSLTQAWQMVPETLTESGFRLNLLPGTYSCEPGPEASNCINFFSDKTGSREYPIIVRAVNGPGTVTIRGGLNIERVHYLYLIDLKLTGGGTLPTNSSGNNLLHLSNGSHVLLRGLDLRGPACLTDACNNLQEVLKANQIQHLYVEDSTIGGAWHSSVDLMVVQYGHFINNRMHSAGQWCMYVKGGSSYLKIDGNELYNCQLGFDAGQSANLAMMLSPWMHYEAYDLKFVNNHVHDIPGVGFAVSGGFNILVAHNTFNNVGTSTDNGYPLMIFNQGERNCTPTDELPDPVGACNSKLGSGGWGPNFQTEGSAVIPNRNIYVFNNLFYNPSGRSTMYSHIGATGGVIPPAGFLNMPSPARSDDNLVIRGNLIWNGPADHPLGIEEGGQGCQNSNSTCNETQLRAENAINTVEPQFLDPAHGDLHPAPGSTIFGATTYAIPDFSWNDAPLSPTLPIGSLVNTVAADREGKGATVNVPGAFRNSDGYMVKRMYGTGYEYAPTIADAYRRIGGNGEKMLLRSGVYGPITFNQPWSFTLHGGFGSGFVSNIGASSIINGKIAITAGKAVFGNIRIR